MLDLRGLFEKTGERLVLDQTIRFDDLELAVSQIACSAVRVTGEICNRSGVVTIDAVAAFDYTAACDRCAAPVKRNFSVPVRHVLVTSLSNEDDGSYFLVEDQKLDLEEMVRSDMILAFPTKYLCKEDCKGLCPVCGQNRNEGDCGCKELGIDPRLAALQELLH